jgi:hypothetical protein
VLDWRSSKALQVVPYRATKPEARIDMAAFSAGVQGDPGRARSRDHRYCQAGVTPSGAGRVGGQLPDYSSLFLMLSTASRKVVMSTLKSQLV